MEAHTSEMGLSASWKMDSHRSAKRMRVKLRITRSCWPERRSMWTTVALEADRAFLTRSASTRRRRRALWSRETSMGQAVVRDGIDGRRTNCRTDAGRFLKVLDQMVDQSVCDVLSAELAVASNGFHLESLPVDVEESHVERPAAKVVDHHQPLASDRTLVRVRDGRCGRLVQDSKDCETCELTCFNRSLTLRILEVWRRVSACSRTRGSEEPRTGRNSDHCSRDLQQDVGSARGQPAKGKERAVSGPPQCASAIRFS